MLKEEEEKEEEEKKNVQEAGMNMIEKKRTICIQCLFQWFSFSPLHDISCFYDTSFYFDFPIFKIFFPLINHQLKLM